MEERRRLQNEYKRYNEYLRSKRPSPVPVNVFERELPHKSLDQSVHTKSKTVTRNLSNNFEARNRTKNNTVRINEPNESENIRKKDEKFSQTR